MEAVVARCFEDCFSGGGEDGVVDYVGVAAALGMHSGVWVGGEKGGEDVSEVAA